MRRRLQSGAATIVGEYQLGASLAACYESNRSIDRLSNL
jgi:hypothetical protein